jgi:hypothetical protein
MVLDHRKLSLGLFLEPIIVLAGDFLGGGGGDKYLDNPPLPVLLVRFSKLGHLSIHTV